MSHVMTCIIILQKYYVCLQIQFDIADFLFPGFCEIVFGLCVLDAYLGI